MIKYRTLLASVCFVEKLRVYNRCPKFVSQNIIPSQLLHRKSEDGVCCHREARQCDKILSPRSWESLEFPNLRHPETPNRETTLRIPYCNYAQLTDTHPTRAPSSKACQRETDLAEAAAIYISSLGSLQGPNTKDHEETR